jgi:hypothetical protein
VVLEPDKGLSNIDDKALVPQTPRGKNYFDLDVIRANEPALRNIINRRARNATPIALASNIRRREAWEIRGLREGHATIFRCAAYPDRRSSDRAAIWIGRTRKIELQRAT